MSERKPGGRPTREQAAAMDDRILDGARAAFCKKGITNTSVEEIAVQLGVSKHTIYRRYPNKGALLEAVVERDISRFRATLASAAGKAMGSIEAVEMTARRYCEIGSSREYAAFYLSVSAEAAISGPLRRLLAVWSKASLEPFERTIKAAQAARFIRQADPSAVCEILVDLLEGVNNRIRLHDDSDGDLPDAEALFADRWNIFMTAIGAVSIDASKAQRSKDSRSQKVNKN